jgi:hypothetical protein
MGCSYDKRFHHTEHVDCGCELPSHVLPNRIRYTWSYNKVSILPFILDNLLEAIANRAVSICSTCSDLKLETSLDD